MKKRLLLFCSAVLSAFCLYGCAIQQTSSKDENSEVSDSSEVDVPEFSSEYLVGTYYGGRSWGEFYDSLSVKVIVCTDHRLLIYLPKVESNKVTDYVQTDSITLTDAQYNAISSKLDCKKLFLLDPEENQEITDGDSSYLLLYGTDQEVAKSCGGYMPQNKDFTEMHRAVMDNLPTDELDRIRSEWIEELKKQILEH